MAVELDGGAGAWPANCGNGGMEGGKQQSGPRPEAILTWPGGAACQHIASLPHPLIADTAEQNHAATPTKTY